MTILKSLEFHHYKKSAQNDFEILSKGKFIIQGHFDLHHPSLVCFKVSDLLLTMVSWLTGSFLWFTSCVSPYEIYDSIPSDLIFDRWEIFGWNMVEVSGWAFSFKCSFTRSLFRLKLSTDVNNNIVPTEQRRNKA